jgi:hypothetical protein
MRRGESKACAHDLSDPQMTQMNADQATDICVYLRHLRIKAGDLELDDVEDDLADVE